MLRGTREGAAAAGSVGAAIARSAAVRVMRREKAAVFMVAGSVVKYEVRLFVERCNLMIEKSFEGLLSQVNELNEREYTQQTAGNRSLLIPFHRRIFRSSSLTTQHSSPLAQPRIVDLSFRMLPEWFDQTLSTATAAIYGAFSSYSPHRVQFPQKSKGHDWLT